MAEPGKRRPSGDELQRLQNAILSAYDFAALKQMVRFELEEDLLSLVPFMDQGLAGMVHDLVFEYASRPGGLHELVTAARAGNPASPELATVAEELMVIEFEPLPDRRPPGKGTGQTAAPPIDVDEALAKLAELPLDEIPPVMPLPPGSHLPYSTESKILTPLAVASATQPSTGNALPPAVRIRHQLRPSATVTPSRMIMSSPG